MVGLFSLIHSIASWDETVYQLCVCVFDLHFTVLEPALPLSFVAKELVLVIVHSVACGASKNKDVFRHIADSERLTDHV